MIGGVSPMAKAKNDPGRTIRLFLLASKSEAKRS